MAKSINDLAQEVRGNTRRIKEVQEKAAKDVKVFNEHRSNNLADLRKLIEAGGTSGNPLHDLLYRAGHVEENVIQQYEKLQSELVGKKGELVLLKYSIKTRMRFGGDVRSSDFRTIKMCRVAPLDGEQLVWKEEITTFGSSYRAVSLPVSRFLEEAWDRFWNIDKMPEPQKPIEEDIFSLNGRHDERVPHTFHTLATAEGGWSDSLFLGNEAVKAELKGSHEKLFDYALQCLGVVYIHAGEAI